MLRVVTDHLLVLEFLASVWPSVVRRATSISMTAIPSNPPAELNLPSSNTYVCVHSLGMLSYKGLLLS